MKKDQKAAATPAVERALRSLGESLRRIRQSRRLTLTAAAARAGTSASTLLRIERGDPSVAVGAYTAVLDIFDVLPAIQTGLSQEAEKAKQMLAAQSAPRRIRPSNRFNF